MTTSNLPIVSSSSSFQEVITTMTSGKLGLCVVIDEDKVQGIITDGDLRRGLENTDLPRFDLQAKNIMTPSPKTITQESMAIDAEEFMLENEINELLVLENDLLVGVLQIYDIGSIK